MHSYFQCFSFHSLFLRSVSKKKHYESESVYASESDLGWSQKIFLEHPPNQNIYYVNMDGLGRPSETIQNLILMHKLIRIRSVSGSTYATVGIRRHYKSWRWIENEIQSLLNSPNVTDASSDAFCNEHVKLLV